MKRRCERCQALIKMEQSGMVCDGDVAERIWHRTCPFCEKDNYYWEEMK